MFDGAAGPGGDEERFGEPEKYVGYGVYNPLEQKIGKCEWLFCDNDGGPAYVRVKMGSFRTRFALLPVGRISVDEEARAILLR